MKITKELIEKIEKEAKTYFVNASGCHDWSHVDRVKKLALRIGKQEKADLQIIEIAALLHDIGRKEEMKTKGLFCHAEAGAKTARKLLKKYSLTTDQVENIVHCIEAHRYRNAHIPNTIEAKILYDADKLDSIGAIGVARDFLFAGNAGSNCLYTGNEKRLAKEKKDYSYTKEDSALLEYEIKLKHVKDKIVTKTGKKIAKQRHEYMKKFFERFWKEVKGEL
ncbi:MAG TPA: phosphohydrolase [Candidatus Moranbacteria bacterium]|nr:phosphohydrolase [Candidatus Moranbacteria bacterium]HBT46182.1 phosphohydrolase [Candidatus Moranbacteria bacterium]